MKKNEIRTKIITFPVFNHYWIKIAISPNLKLATSKCPAARGIDMTDTDGLTVHIKNASKSYIFLRPTAGVNEISHESLHAVNRMLSYMDVAHDSECDAYHLGYLAGKIAEFIHRCRRAK